MTPWTRRKNRPQKPGFTKFLPHSERLLPVWDELATMAEQEDRRLEVVLNGKAAYVLIGDPENGAEVVRVCPKQGVSEIPLSCP